MHGRQFSLRISLFYLTSFLVFGIFLPFFPLWLQARGLSSREIAIAMAAPMAARIVIVPLMTLAADRMGDRRLIVGVCALAALAALCAMPAASGFGALLLLAILYTGAMTPVTPIVESIAVEGASRLAVDYGRMRLWGSLSFIGGSIGAGVLLDAVTPSGVIWLLVGACALMVVSAGLLPGRARERNIPKPSAAGLARFGAALFAAPQFLLFVVAAGAVMSSHAVFYAFGSVHWRTLGFDGPTIGLLWATGVAAEVALFAFAARLVAPIPAPLLLLGGAAGGVVRWTVTAIDPPLALLLPLQTLHALSFAATHLGAMKFLQSAVPAHLASFGQGLYFAVASGLFMGLALFAAGPLYAAFAGRAYLAMALLCAGGAIFAAGLNRRWQGGLVVRASA
ncbi:MAG: MFS transporter [Pseudomonadota bacterium]|nr:MFS transporter [Pseudomonadota bacterium]